ncbi:hypothetical protein I7I48_09111 [Histoplasma ohiense]|nr:hypothetical protein I7I48_09111 [Histoplasma ohiense (nom. inval.)]
MPRIHTPYSLSISQSQIFRILPVPPMPMHSMQRFRYQRIQPSICEIGSQLPLQKIKVFLGQIIYMGVHRSPAIEDYWNMNDAQGPVHPFYCQCLYPSLTGYYWHYYISC